MSVVNRTESTNREISVSLPEELDAGNLQVRFCEGPEPTDIGLKYCGTAGETRRQAEKTNLNLWYLEKPVYSTQSPLRNSEFGENDH